MSPAQTPPSFWVPITHLKGIALGPLPARCWVPHLGEGKQQTSHSVPPALWLETGSRVAFLVASATAFCPGNASGLALRTQGTHCQVHLPDSRGWFGCPRRGSTQLPGLLENADWFFVFLSHTRNPEPRKIQETQSGEGWGAGQGDCGPWQAPWELTRWLTVGGKRRRSLSGPRTPAAPREAWGSGERSFTYFVHNLFRVLELTWGRPPTLKVSCTPDPGGFHRGMSLLDVRILGKCPLLARCVCGTLSGPCSQSQPGMASAVMPMRGLRRTWTWVACGWAQNAGWEAWVAVDFLEGA